MMVVVVVRFDFTLNTESLLRSSVLQTLHSTWASSLSHVHVRRFVQEFPDPQAVWRAVSPRLALDRRQEEGGTAEELQHGQPEGGDPQECWQRTAAEPQWAGMMRPHLSVGPSIQSSISITFNCPSIANDLGLSAVHLFIHHPPTIPLHVCITTDRQTITEINIHVKGRWVDDR